MSGHSKWSNIKRKKGATDAKRAKQFTRATKNIHIAVKEGGGVDPNANATLRNAISNAKGINMPKDKIQNAIKKASGEGSENYEKVSFEGYGPHGIAFFIECTTDNTNRAVSNIRAIFSKFSGSLGKNGSLEFLFDHKGVFTIEEESISKDLDELELELIESGLESIEKDDELIIIISDLSDFGTMTDAFEKKGIEIKNSTLERIPVNSTELPLDQAKTILKLEEAFDDDDDVQNVFHNMKMTDALLEEIEKGEI